MLAIRCNIQELQILSQVYVRFDMIQLDFATGCWVWTGRKNRNGYGRENGKSPVLHRRVYEMLRGAVAPGMFLDHVCRNRACCNPAHLEPVSPRENTLRGMASLYKEMA